MKALRLALSATIFAALLQPCAAQLELKVDPLQRKDLLVPPAAAGEGFQLQPFLRVQGNVIINRGGLVILDGESMEAPQAEPDPAGPQVLDFASGHRLHGSIESLDLTGGQLIWRRTDASAPLSIPLDQITRVSFDNKPKTDAPAAATVKFTGGDWLAAEVTAIQGDKIQLRVGDGARLTTDRAHVEWIYFSKSGSAECYDGPTSLAGWTSAGSWTYREGSLRAVSPSPITRHFQSLPDRVEYRMTVDQGSILNAFTLSLHGPVPGQPRPQKPGAIQLMLRSNTLVVWAAVGGGMKSQPHDVAALLSAAGRAKGPLHFRVLEDFTAGRMLVFINGRKVCEAHFDAGEAGKNGGSFQFQPTSWSSDQEQSISKIQVVPWNGREFAEEDEVPGDRVSLVNGEMKTGKVASWDGRTLKLETSSGAASVPREQVSLLRFLRPKNPPDEDAPTGHVRLVQGGEFDAVTLGWRDGKITARTNFGGELALASSAVAELEFRRGTRSPSAAADVLVFKNGDRLRGVLEGAAEQGKVRWQTDKSAPAVEFSTGQLAGLQFAVRSSGPPSGFATRFRNGDWLPGSFVTLDREQVVLDAGAVGQLAIPRPLVKTLYFGDGAAALSDGTSDHELWERGLEMNPNSSTRKKADALSPWSYFAGSYSLTRPISNNYSGTGPSIHLGRTFPTLPARAEMSFTVTSQRSSVFCSAQVFTEPNNPGYMLHLNTGEISLYDMNPRMRNRGVFQQQFPLGKEIKPDARTRRVRLLADRTSGRMTMLVDGVIVGQVNARPADGPRNLGRGMMIMPQLNMPCSFSDIWVGPWNGQVPGKTTPTAPAPETVVLANGDEAQGTVELATPTLVKVASDVGPLALSVERLTTIDFGGSPSERQPGTRLQLTGGGALTVSAWRIENATLICRSEIAGEIKLPLAQVQEIIFATSPKNDK